MLTSAIINPNSAQGNETIEMLGFQISMSSDHSINTDCMYLNSTSSIWHFCKKKKIILNLMADERQVKMWNAQETYNSSESTRWENTMMDYQIDLSFPSKDRERYIW